LINEFEKENVECSGSGLSGNVIPEKDKENYNVSS
jgi:hypothetical protein